MEEERSCGSTDGPPRTVRLHNGPCVKCQAPRSFAVTRTRRLCKTCFGAACVSSAMYGLNEARVRRGPPSIVVVGLSGGPSSTALLAFLRHELDARVRGASFTLVVVWVNCVEVMPWVDGAALRARVEEAARGLALEEVALHTFFRGPDAPALLQRVFGGAPGGDVTWKEELVDHMVRSLLLRHTLQRGARRLLVGDSMMRACIKMVASISRGVGSTAAATVASCDPHTYAQGIWVCVCLCVLPRISRCNFLSSENVILVRPLSRMSGAEVALGYRALFGRNVSPVPSFSHPLVTGTAQSARSSARSLAETFLNRLECGHAQSLHVLVGTAHKLQSPGAYAPEWLLCQGCDPKLRRKGNSTPPPPAVESAHRRRCLLCRLVVEEAKEEPHSAGAACGQGQCGGGQCGGCGCEPRVPFLCAACAKVTAHVVAASGVTLAQLCDGDSNALRPSCRAQQRERIADCLLSDDEE